MKIIVQRVSEASVEVENMVTGKINKGLLLLVGIHNDDTKEEADWCCNKISKLRIFEDEDQKMNLSVKDVGGSLLVVSQFTLYGNVKKGTRPSFIEAARPEKAEPLYNYIVNRLEQTHKLPVETGKFGAMMNVKLINDGPVTLVVEK
jgi:D-tyrosyl-tRNA(Tyr) deacylase